MNFHTVNKAICTFLMAAFFVMATNFASPSYALEAAQKAEFEELIRSYLLKNPEIILEVQDALDKKRALEASLKVERILTEKRDLVFASENQSNIGNPNGDVTVVEFFDYNCAFCKRALSDMQRLLKEDSNLKFVMKELPILGEGSVTAHRISIAVGKLVPDRYEEFHEKLLGANGQKNGERALKLAESMGMDMRKILDYSKRDSVIEGFREVNNLATDLGMNGTPSYVIGNEVIFGALGYDVLKQKITNLRKCGNTISC